MSYKEKLIELLKEVEEIKEDLEGPYNETYIGFIRVCPQLEDWFNSCPNIDILNQELNFAFGIGELEERHLRMYCESKGIYICITTSGFICGVDIDKPFTKLDNKKSFDNQEDKIYKEMLEYLLDNNLLK